MTTKPGGGDGYAGSPPALHGGGLGDGREVRVYASRAALADAGAAVVAASLARAIAARGHAVLSLAGGTTPRALYQRLAAAHHDDVEWDRVTVTFGDERCVPPDSEWSNYRMAAEALLDRVPVRRELVHRVHGELPPARAADEYDGVMRTLAGGAVADARPAHTLREPVFDVTILGVGADGHTASLIPGSPAVGERDRWAVAVSAPHTVPGPSERVTLTFPVLRASRLVVFLATGAAKQDAVRASLLSEGPTAGRPPASRVRATERTVWLLDGEAAGDELTSALSG